MTRTAVLVSGSRRWTERAPVIARLQRYPKGTILIHGDNGEFVRMSADPYDGYWRGLDKIAHELCGPLGFIPHPYPYFRDKGKIGGPKRNRCMFDVLLVMMKWGYVPHFEAFPDEKSVGTRDMIDVVKAHNERHWLESTIPIHVTEG